MLLFSCAGTAAALELTISFFHFQSSKSSNYLQRNIIECNKHGFLTSPLGFRVKSRELWSLYNYMYNTYKYLD